MNQHQASQHARILALVSAFEAEVEAGAVKFRKEEELLEMSDYYVQEQLPEQALEVLDFGISCFPYSSIFFFRKARLFIDLNREELAMAVLDEGEAKFGGDFDFHILRAEAFSRLGLFEHAHAILDELK